MAIVGLAGFVGVIVCIVMLLIELIRKRPKKKILIGMMICFVLFFVAVSASDSSKKDITAESTKSPEPSMQAAAPSESEPTPSDNGPHSDETIDISDYMGFDAEVLFEYGGYLGGEKIVTVIEVASVDGKAVKAHTENNDSFFFSVVCYFDGDVPSGIEKGDILTIAGTVEEKSEILETLSFLDTPTATIENCSIVGHGEIAQELKNGAVEQQAIGAQRKAEVEAQIAAAKKEERDNYIAQCQTVDYNDVARNPDSYDGTMVKITGKVVQVSEGWFDSVTLRIDCGGDVWYVTYSREEGESRILEGDQITGYGECNGVTSYTTVLGSQVTIPSMKMKYYN